MAITETSRPQIKGLEAVYGNVVPGNKEKVAERIRLGDMMIEFKDPNGYLDQVSDHVDKGAAIVTFSNHTQHLNVAGFIKSYRERRSRNKKGYIGVAHSLVNTGQKESLVLFAQGLALNLEDDSVWLVPFARDQDVMDYKKRFGRSKAKEILRETHENLDFVSNQIAFEDSEFMYFPEDTTTGGTKKHWWSRKHRGMVEVKNDMALRLIEAAVSTDKDIVFSGLSMIGFDRIVPPRRTRPSIQALFETARYKILTAMHVDSKMRKLAKVVVEKPVTLIDLLNAGILEYKLEDDFSYDNIYIPTDKGERRELSDKINKFLMESLASLPEDHKGVYSQRVKVEAIS